MEIFILLLIMGTFGAIMYLGVQKTKETRQQMIDEIESLEEKIYESLPEAPDKPEPTVSSDAVAKTAEKKQEEKVVTSDVKPKPKKRYYKKKPKNPNGGKPQTNP